MKKFYLVVLFCMLLLLSGCATTIDLTPYVDVEFEGYDGEGTAYYEIDYEELITDYEDVFGFDKKGLEKKSGQRFLEDVMEAIDGELSENEELSNGDEITFSWELDAENLEKEYKVKFSVEDVTVKVKRLDDPEEYIAADPTKEPAQEPDIWGWPEPTSVAEEIIPSATPVPVVTHALADYVGTYDISIWMPYTAMDTIVELTEEQIREFCNRYPGVEINATVNAMSTHDSAYIMMEQAETDIFCFSQDMLQILMLDDVPLLSPLDSENAQKVKEANDEGSVKAVTYFDEVYGYPLTSENGYFMYYDKSVIPEEHLDSLEKILEDCEAAGRKFCMNLSNGWYNASFMFATGCTSEWYLNDVGEVLAVSDDFNSEKGLTALKGMQKAFQSPVFYDGTYYGTDYGYDSDAAVVISGIWAMQDMTRLFEENYGAADLPSFTVDGNSYHMSSFSGHTILGVKPQEDEKREYVLHQLALYLSGETCQTERFGQEQMLPSNRNVQNTLAPYLDEAYAAFFEQNMYAVPQGSIYGYWWEYASQLYYDAEAATTEEGLLDALSWYADKIYYLFW